MFLLTSGLRLWGNPFLGQSDEVTPAVRPPSSGGFMVETQLRFREALGEQLMILEEGANPAVLLTLLGLAFIYGVLHAAGPGHRKTVVFSMFLTRKARWYEPILASLTAAGVHGGTAVILILLFQLIFSRIQSVQVQNVSSWLEGISFILLMVLSLWFLIRSFKPHSHHHAHGESDKGIYTTLALTSLFPCPGVVMIMTFSAALGVIKTGIISVVSLSAGMGVTISIAAYLAYFGREGLFRILKEKEHLVGRISTLLERGSFLFLLLFSLWMAYPFLRTIIIGI